MYKEDIGRYNLVENISKRLACRNKAVTESGRHTYNTDTPHACMSDSGTSASRSSCLAGE